MSDKKKDLFALCEEFVDIHNIRSPESVYQTDIDESDIKEFIIKLCDIVGYFEDEEAGG